MLTRLKIFLQRFREAWLACILCMVQGDLTVVSIGHALTAAKTGAIAGVAFVVCSFWTKVKDNLWVTTWLVGVLTALADYLVHPTHFGGDWTEAVVTGVAASSLCFFMVRYVDPK